MPPQERYPLRLPLRTPRHVCNRKAVVEEYPGASLKSRLISGLLVLVSSVSLKSVVRLNSLSKAGTSRNMSITSKKSAARGVSGSKPILRRRISGNVKQQIRKPDRSRSDNGNADAHKNVMYPLLYLRTRKTAKIIVTMASESETVKAPLLSNR